MNKIVEFTGRQKCGAMGCQEDHDSFKIPKSNVFQPCLQFPNRPEQEIRFVYMFSTSTSHAFVNVALQITN